MAGLTKAALLAIGAVVCAAAIGALAYHPWRNAGPLPIAAITPPAPAAHSSSVRAGAASRRHVTTEATPITTEATPGVPTAKSAAPIGRHAESTARTPPHAEQPKRPSFDVVRVERTGDTVVAGRAAPNAEVALLDKGNVIAKTKADAGGQFTFIPPPLHAGDHLLALGEKTGKGRLISKQTVTVAVPKAKGGEAVAALTEPNQPTRLLTSPPPAPAAGTASKATKTPQVAIRTVETGQRGGFFATGTAAPGAQVRLYLNGSVLGDLRTKPDGSWSLHITKGMQPGGYTVRADQIDAAGKVVARAQVPFDYQAVAPAEAGGQGSGKALSGEGALAAAISTVTVVHGDSLWRISRKVLGRGIRYTEIYAANASQIRNPALIYPGQVFVIPQIKAD